MIQGVDDNEPELAEAVHIMATPARVRQAVAKNKKKKPQDNKGQHCCSRNIICWYQISLHVCNLYIEKFRILHFFSVRSLWKRILYL